MRRFFALFAFFIVPFLFAFQKMNKPVRVIFFGDSITEAGVEPGGYISQMREMVAAEGKNDVYELIGSGIGGNKIYDLYLRFERDVLPQKPDIVVIYVGVNDVWHKRTHGTGTDPDKFRNFYEALIGKLQTQGIRLVLCTPACIGEKSDCTNPQDGELNQYAQMIRDLAAQYKCGLCDLRTAFLNHEAENNSANKDKGILTTDGVHLNDAGNKMVATMLLGKIRSN
ncbi:MAG: Acetylxylan esterase [Saprospiraceae bacterium]|nr:Acetylxylan esterase [Saprospiraceae bacterium]